MSAALGLYRLQQVDSQIDHARARLNAIQQTLENDEELRLFNERSITAEKKLREAERLLAQCEEDVEKQRIKIQQAEASLYGGLVHNPKELQDLQKDVASLKRHLETLEERELQAMETVETAEHQRRVPVPADADRPEPAARRRCHALAHFQRFGPVAAQAGEHGRSPPHLAPHRGLVP